MRGCPAGRTPYACCFCFVPLRAAWTCGFFVVHVEHGIRGEESLADARFVRDLCKRLSVPASLSGGRAGAGKASWPVSGGGGTDSAL